MCVAPERRNGGNHAAAVGTRQVLQGPHELRDETSSHHPLHQLPGCAAPAVQRLGGTPGVQLSPRPHGVWGVPQPSQVQPGGEPVLQRLDGGEVRSGRWQGARSLSFRAPHLPSFANPVPFLSQVCQWVLKCRNSKNSLIQMTILNLLPRLAAFRPSAFTGEGVCGRRHYPLKGSRTDRSFQKVTSASHLKQGQLGASLWFLCLVSHFSGTSSHFLQVAEAAGVGTVRTCRQRGSSRAKQALVYGTNKFIGGLKRGKRKGSFVLHAAAASRWDGGFVDCPASPPRWSLRWPTTHRRGCISQGQVSWTVGWGFPYSCPVVTGQ